jgi:hypothetical protein
MNAVQYKPPGEMLVKAKVDNSTNAESPFMVAKFLSVRTTMSRKGTDEELRGSEEADWP